MDISFQEIITTTMSERKPGEDRWEGCPQCRDWDKEGHEGLE